MPLENFKNICTQYILKKDQMVSSKIRFLLVNGWFSRILHPSSRKSINKLIKPTKYDKSEFLANKTINIILTRRIVSK